MKKYYFNEERLKDFEKTECGINLADILTVRIVIGGELFQMHEGTLLSYERKIDYRTGVLTRRVRWKNSAGDITDICFERFASYADEHIYCQKITVSPVNHGKPIEIYSGMDLRTKTNGQRVTQIVSESAEGTSVCAEIKSGPRYGFGCAFSAENRILGIIPRKNRMRMAFWRSNSAGAESACWKNDLRGYLARYAAAPSGMARAASANGARVLCRKL